jgi:hypothetical protein
MSLLPVAPFSVSAFIPNLPLVRVLICNFYFSLSTFYFLMVSQTDIAVWTASALLAIGIGSSRYAKKRTRDKFLAELAAMDPERREKVLSRLEPKLQMELRQKLMLRYGPG